MNSCASNDPAKPQMTGTGGPNMPSLEHVSVLTGDLIGFTKNAGDPEIYLNELEAGLALVSRSYSFSYQIFRGDSFQGILLDPGRSLEAALLLRSYLLSRSSRSESVAGDIERTGVGKSPMVSPPGMRKRRDVRIAIGVGEADFYDIKAIGRSDGAAFRMSGHKLDEMKKPRQNLAIVTPWDDLNGELDVECALLDVMISKWTREQALAVLYSLQGLSQYQISDRRGRHQGGISQSLARAGYWALEKMLARFDENIERNMGRSPRSSVQ